MIPPPPPPAHHDPDGGFRTPWHREERGGGRFPFLRWLLQRWRDGRPPSPDPSRIPTAVPDPARPRWTGPGARITWVGHATFLIQCGGINLLTDPVFGHRASPLPIGPSRFLPPALRIEDLPPIDAVLLSHDHYDHLDRHTVRKLLELQGDTVTWCTPLGYRRWFASQGVSRVVELDWWESRVLEIPATGVHATVTCAPAQHWTRRGLSANTRLWGSFAVRFPAAGGRSGPSVYFGGDSGYFDGYARIADRLGPFDVTLLPIGAYEPRWFMRRSHMNPEEAVRAFLDLGARGHFIGMHWGTFRLTDEAPLEPPDRTRAAWADAGLPADRLHLPGIGGTIEI